jgi:hypothetical protein
MGQWHLYEWSRKTYTASTWPYSLSANGAHELGHCLCRDHQAPIPGRDVNSHQVQTANGATPAVTDDVCIMGYKACYGEFCGRCVLALRGWKTKSAATMAGA